MISLYVIFVQTSIRQNEQVNLIIFISSCVRAFNPLFVSVVILPLSLYHSWNIKFSLFPFYFFILSFKFFLILEWGQLKQKRWAMNIESSQDLLLIHGEELNPGCKGGEMEKHNLKVVRCKGGGRHYTPRTNLSLYLRSFSVYPLLW